jgi:ribosome biogenesis GTPase
VSTGRIYRKVAHGYHVAYEDDGTRVCTLSPKLSRSLGGGATDPLAIGDLVETEGEVITAILPRSNKLSRPAPGKKPLEQIIAANIDQVVTVFAAARPQPAWNLLDRYLVAAEAAELRVLICITKLDLGDRDDIAREMALYRAMGYPVVFTSAETGEGVVELRAALAGNVSLLVGKSGVGKSSLLNAVEPGLGAQIGKVSEGKTGKGKHTTTGSEMFALAVGGYLIDTPGIREFGLWAVDTDDVGIYFREIAPHLGACRFGAGCSHVSEPGCAVRAAVEVGQVSRRRYESYLRLRDETR